MPEDFEERFPPGVQSSLFNNSIILDNNNNTSGFVLDPSELFCLGSDKLLMGSTKLFHEIQLVFSAGLVWGQLGV